MNHIDLIALRQLMTNISVLSHYTGALQQLCNTLFSLYGDELASTTEITNPEWRTKYEIYSKCSGLASQLRVAQGQLEAALKHTKSVVCEILFTGKETVEVGAECNQMIVRLDQILVETREAARAARRRR